MPELEPNLLHTTGKDHPRRAGTPGRAPRTWRAVVDYWRPLRLFIGLPLIFCGSHPAAAQVRLPDHPSLQLRVGALYTTPLIKDQVSSITVDTAIPGVRSDLVTLRQQLAPIATLALRIPVRPKLQLEVSGSAAHATIRGDDGLTTWDAASATIGNVVFGFGWLYRNAVVLHGGVGATRIFTAERGMFTRGNSIKPLLEAGAATSIPLGGHSLDIDARVQSHSFGTATLRDNGGSDGSVLRAIIQIGTTVWHGRQQ